MISNFYKSIKKWLKRVAIAGFLFITIIAVSATIIIQTSFDDTFNFNLNEEIINDITGLNPIPVSTVIAPKTTDEIIKAIRSSKGPISIGGGRYSQGGQIAYQDSLHIDMRDFNRVINFNKDKKEITVQPGITWRDIQEYIDPYNLSLKIMQTYANFTVGGSLSVNVHGRYIGQGPLVFSVKSIKLILADGRLIKASQTENVDLFYGAIGGYGGLGVIVEATLSLTNNIKIERSVKKMPISDYQKYFFENIRSNPNIILDNADIYPPNYDKVLDVSWSKSEKALTNDARIIPKDEKYFWGPLAEKFVADYSIGKWLREHVLEPIYYSEDRVVWRNWEASYDVAELEPKSRQNQTFVLCEYFVPVENFSTFIPKMKKIFNKHQVNVLNVSIRHVFADKKTLLSWAPTESFAFVVYYRQGVDPQAREAVKAWNKEMIDAVFSVGGTYYLPYKVLASFEQFAKAYPRYKEFFALKQKVDPNYRFRNELWKKYYINAHRRFDEIRLKINKYERGEEQTFLTVPEWYLVFNPLEYADYLEKGYNPSNFPYLKSIRMYWRMYGRVKSICDGRYPENTEYITMLRVIGISTTVELMLKGAYENTMGRFTRWLTNNQDVEEDNIIAQANRAYSRIIFDKPWYEFDFMFWVHCIWKKPDFFGKNFTRKLERKFSFSLEYSFKALYAWLIQLAVQSTYTPSEGLVYMTVTLPTSNVKNMPKKVKILAEENNKMIISMPRWGDFSKIIPMLVEKGVKFNDISGNKKITVSLVSDSKDASNLQLARLIFSDHFVSDSSKIRSVVLVSVNNLSAAIKEAQHEGFQIEHIYDY